MSERLGALIEDEDVANDFHDLLETCRKNGRGMGSYNLPSQDVTLRKAHLSRQTYGTRV